MRMFRKFTSLGLLLFMTLVGESFALRALSQDRTDEEKALQLRGKVTKVTRRVEDQSHIVFDVNLELEIVNKGVKPIILLKREPWLGAELLARSPEDAASNRYVYNSSHWPSVYRASGNEWERLTQKLDQSSPPSELTLILYPQATWKYETSTILYIEKKGSFDKTSKPWDEIRQISPLWLQVVLEMWPINVEPRVDPENLEFGKKLRRRWQQDGELWLDKILSEPISINLNDAEGNITK